MMSGSLTATPPAPVLEFDVCVIGAGAAGLVLTELLSRKGLRVCLVEAGPEQFKHRQEPFRVRSLLKEHIGVNEGRVTAFGGATNTWGGGLLRLSSADLEPLEGRPDTGWPMSHESLARHYREIESLFGSAAFPEDEQSIFLEDADVIVRRRTVPILPFRNKNFARRFGPTLRNRQNVTILCDADIVRFHGVPGRGIVNLDVCVKRGAPTRVVARRFVVSAGTVNTNLLAARILKEGGASDLREEHGRFFHDHLSFPIGVICPKSSYRFSRRFGYRFTHGFMYAEHFDIETKGRRKPGAFFHLVFDTSQSSILRPVRTVLNAIQQRTISLKSLVSPKDLGPLLLGLPRLGLMRYLHRRLYIDSGTAVLATLDLEQVPDREWQISADDDGTGGKVAWDVAREDAANAARYIPVCRKILARLQAEAAFAFDDCLPADPTVDFLLEHLKREAKDTFHFAGGLRMSDAPDALVDPQLRLVPVPNVHLLSSAVFPRVGTSNPTHTILALADRLAQHLLERPSGDR